MQRPSRSQACKLCDGTQHAVTPAECAPHTIKLAIRGTRTSPLLRLLFKVPVVVDVLLRDLRVLRVLGRGALQQQLQAHERGLKAQRWRPLIFQDVEADGAGLARDVGVPDLQHRSAMCAAALRSCEPCCAHVQRGTRAVQSGCAAGASRATGVGKPQVDV